MTTEKRAKKTDLMTEDERNAYHIARSRKVDTGFRIRTRTTN